jgi:CBS domain-containing protein
MSTRWSTYVPNALARTATDGNRESQPPRKLVPSLGNHAPERRAIGRQQAPARLRPILTARDLMRVCAATLRPEDSIERAARLICESDSDAVPVVDDTGRLIGTISGRDITLKLIAPGASIPLAQVSDCMTSEAFACSADNSLEGCVTAMSWHQVRWIPIVDDEHRVIGTISQKDLVGYLCEHPERVERKTMTDILWALA